MQYGNSSIGYQQSFLYQLRSTTDALGAIFLGFEIGVTVEAQN